MAKPFSVIFAGTPDFAVPSLHALATHANFDVQLVVTQPDRPVGRKQVLTAPPVKTCAAEHGIPVLQVEKLQPTDLSKYECDFLVVVAFGQILPQKVLDMPRIAPVNVHGSVLPRWRGAAPIHAAVLAGDSTTGVTIQHMVYKLDAGDILAQLHTPIAAEDTTEILYERLANMGASLLIQTLQQPLQPVPQDENLVTVCKKLTRKDGQVDPQTMTADTIHRHVRALVPWPGVTCPLQNQTVKLLRTSLQQGSNALALDCAEHTTLYIQELQSPGKKVMNGAQWIQAHQ